MAIDYIKESKQELVLLQLDIEKAYDNVDWSFINQWMAHMQIAFLATYSRTDLCTLILSPETFENNSHTSIVLPIFPRIGAKNII